MRPRKLKRRKLSKSEQMARVRSKDTDLEMTLRRRLWHSGLRYRLRPKLPGTPDLAFMRSKVAVFVDGCFWHGCPQHHTFPVTNASFWRKKLKRNMDRDRRVDRELLEMGWEVIRVWEHEVKEDCKAVVLRISERLRVRQSRHKQDDSC